MSIVGYNTTLKVTGTPTAMSSEAMSTHSTAANTYKIGDATKEIWDRTASISVFEATTTGGRVQVSSAQISNIDYLFGTVTFTVAQTAPITVSGTYLPTANAAGAHAFSLDLARELLDDTDFTSTGWRSRQKGLLDAGVSVTRWDSIDQDYFDDINSGTPVVVEIKPKGTTADVIRGFFVTESENRSGDVASLESAELSYQLDGSTLGDFSWQTN